MELLVEVMDWWIIVAISILLLLVGIPRMEMLSVWVLTTRFLSRELIYFFTVLYVYLFPLRIVSSSQHAHILLRHILGNNSARPHPVGLVG